MAEHTPLPWIAAAKFSSVVGVPIVNGTGARIANTSMPGLPEEWPEHRKRRAEADAAFIVKAVNNHEALVKALEQAKAAMLRTRAASIAGCEEGYGRPEKWADELFQSHGGLTASIKVIDLLLDGVGQMGDRS